MDDLYNYITEGAILRSKVRWYEEGEKSTKYFLNLEKSNRNKTSIKKLIKPDSEIEITGFNEIQKEIKSFYQSLYSRKSLKTEKQCLDYLKDINTPKITTQQKMVCEEKLTVKCFDTLLTMSNGKSPGNDGLAKKFYVCFWEDLGSLHVDTLNYAFQYGELSTSQRQAVITLIKQKGRDKRLIKNWRPISLINVDTKIASKSLAIRIKEFLPQLVDCDQTAYVKGRNIGESIRLIDDLLEYADKENLDGLIFAADIEKAFDSIEHNFLLATLTKYGFGLTSFSGLKHFFQTARAVL